MRRALFVEGRFAQAPETELLFDPQTAGGLLLALPGGAVEEALRVLHAGGDGQAAVIGRVEPTRADGALVAVESIPAPT